MTPPQSESPANRNVATGLQPPGQAATHKFPVTGEKAPATPALDLKTWRLHIEGLVENALSLGYDELLAMPQAELTADVHCVTGWSQYAMRFTGLPLAGLLAIARPTPAARFVRFAAYSDRGHDTSLPLELALTDTWLVHSFDGRPLEPAHGWPLRTVTPSRYFYKSLKWVHRIELLAEDRLGYWERESQYHNNADWRSGQERYTSGAIKPERVAAFRSAKDYARYRGPHNLLLSVDLRGWSPCTTDLGELHIKNSDLREARLAGTNLRGANLTRSDLRGANLRGADLRGADLEGVQFAGADLCDADLTSAALSAATFFEARPNGTTLAARIDGLRWDGVSGLLEAQERFLRD